MPIATTYTHQKSFLTFTFSRLIELTHIEDDSEFKSVVFCSLDKLNGEDNGSSESSKALADEDNSRVWTDEEQNLLEAAIRSIPKTESKRWEKVCKRCRTCNEKLLNFCSSIILRRAVRCQKVGIL